MPAEPETQASAKEEQFRAVAEILAVGLQRFIHERRTLKARSTPSTPEPVVAASDSEQPRETKAAPRDRHPSVEDLIETKAREIRQQCCLPATDLDDLRQSIRLDLLKRQHLFDPQRASWEWFAKVVINSWAAMYLRDRKRLKRAGEQRTVFLHDTSDSLEPGYWLTHRFPRRTLISVIPGPPNPPELRFERREALALAMQGLSSQHRRVVLAVARNGRASTARELGVSRRQIDNIVNQARLQFEAVGLGVRDLG